MHIYLDLKKAVQVPNTSTGPVTDRRAARQYEESFNRQSAGALGGEPTHDDPQQGGKWSHDEEDSVDNELEAARKKDSQIAQERGIILADKTEKSEAAEMLKSFASALGSHLDQFAPNPAEVEYLTTQCFKSEVIQSEFGPDKYLRVPYTRDDVFSGRARIEGLERAKFNSWLQERFQKSLGKLIR